MSEPVPLPTMSMPPPLPDAAHAGDVAMIRELCGARSALASEIAKRIVGQHEVVEHLLIALFARGHGLFVGVPGLAKTMLIQTLAEALDLAFGRIQFTPDMMPSDITGSDVLEEDRTNGRRVFRFVRGPVFANLVLADEINRTPPKTQAALLQAMQEYRVSTGGNDYPLPLPFLVFATQNPIEQEGTYPLPEAQLDRFMFQIDVGYPSAAEEIRIAAANHGPGRPGDKEDPASRPHRRAARPRHARARGRARAEPTRSRSAGPPGQRRRRRRSYASMSPGAPAREHRSTWSRPPRRAPPWRAGSPYRSRTCASLPHLCWYTA